MLLLLCALIGAGDNLKVDITFRGYQAVVSQEADLFYITPTHEYMSPKLGGNGWVAVDPQKSQLLFSENYPLDLFKKKISEVKIKLWECTVMRYKDGKGGLYYVLLDIKPMK